MTTRRATPTATSRFNVTKSRIFVTLCPVLAGILRQEEGLREAGRGQDQGPAQDLHGHQVQQDDGLRKIITKTTSQSSSLFHFCFRQASEKTQALKLN